MNYSDYFKFRQVSPDFYENYPLQPYLAEILNNTELRILDFGCGFGQVLMALRKLGFKNIEGLDIEPEALEHCRLQNLACFDGSENVTFYETHEGVYDYIILSHVLEHIPKNLMITQLQKIKTLLKPDGGLIVAVPNAQSHTGAYWRYEDFTHHYLFTSGSLYFVLRAAGFKEVRFLDIDCTAGASWLKFLVKKVFLPIYVFNYWFWNKVTTSAIHSPSPMIFSYEIKALAKK